MALVTTATVDNGELFTWNSRTGFEPEQAIPIGEQIFDGTQIVPAVDATDTATWTLQLNLSRNWAHRIQSLEINVRTAGAADIDEWQPAMNVRVSSDKAGIADFVSYNFELLGQAYLIQQSSQWQSSFVFLTSGVLDTVRFFHPVSLPRDELIDVSEAARMLVRYFNASASATSALTIAWHARTLLYEISDYNNYLTHLVWPPGGP